MNPIAEKLINIWADYFEYDPDRTSFQLGSRISYGHLYADKIKNLIEYDTEGLVVALYIKKSILESLDRSNVKLIDIVQNNDIYSQSKFVYDEINSKEVDKIEKDLYSMISRFRSIWVGESLNLESTDTKISDVLLDDVDGVVESLKSLNLTIYQKGGKISDNISVNTNFYQFDSLAEAVLTIESMPEGLTFAYVNQGISSDGFFSFFIKSNGNLISIDERIQEMYYGQHHNMRNGRYLDNKGYSLFPYDIFKYQDYDYKGYARSYIIDDSIKQLKDLQDENINRLVIAIFLIISKYKNTVIEGEEFYIDSLMPQNINLILDSKTVELAKRENNSIINNHSEFKVNFTEDQILNGFEDDSQECIASKDNLYVKYYSDGFKPDFDAAVYHPSIKALPSGEDEECVVDNEFIATKSHYNRVIYKNLRKQLADYIEIKMKDEFDSLGGWNYFKDWLNQNIKNNIEYIRDVMCVESYLFGESSMNTMGQCSGWISLNPENDPYYNFRVKYDLYKTDPKYVWNYRTDKLIYKYDRDVKDIDSNTNCNIWFEFVCQKGSDVIEFFKLEDAPNLIKCYNSDAFGVGNSILDITDPVTKIKPPFYYHSGSFNSQNYEKSFEFIIPMSIRSLNNKIKKYIESHKDEEEYIKTCLQKRKKHMNNWKQDHNQY